jgi:hypothetical protein
MQAHDGWVCRDPFGKGTTVCFAQCATFKRWPGSSDTSSLFKTVASSGFGGGTVEVKCPTDYTMLSGGRAIEFSNIWDNSSKLFDINNVSLLVHPRVLHIHACSL